MGKGISSLITAETFFESLHSRKNRGGVIGMILNHSNYNVL